MRLEIWMAASTLTVLGGEERGKGGVLGGLCHVALPPHTCPCRG